MEGAQHNSKFRRTCSKILSKFQSTVQCSRTRTQQCGQSLLQKYCKQNCADGIQSIQLSSQKKVTTPTQFVKFLFLLFFFTSCSALNCYLHKAQPQHSRLQQHFLNDVIRIFDFDREIDRAVLPSNRARKAPGTRYVVEKYNFGGSFWFLLTCFWSRNCANQLQIHLLIDTFQKNKNQILL